MACAICPHSRSCPDRLISSLPLPRLFKSCLVPLRISILQLSSFLHCVSGSSILCDTYHCLLLLSAYLQSILNKFFCTMHSILFTFFCLASISFGQNCGPQYENQTCATGLCCMPKDPSPQCPCISKPADDHSYIGSGAGWVNLHACRIFLICSQQILNFPSPAV